MCQFKPQGYTHQYLIMFVFFFNLFNMMAINKEKYIKSLMICVLSSLCFQTRAVMHLSMVLKSTQMVYSDPFQQHKFIVCYVSVHNNILDLTKNYCMILIIYSSLIKGKTIQEEEFCSGKCNLVFTP